jgi:hypothetical protein
MNNPADQIVERNTSPQTPTKGIDPGKEFRHYKDNKRFLAKIFEATTDTDVWKIKLYERGYGTLTTPQDPTSEPIMAYTINNQSFQVGQRVWVTLRPNGMSMIVPDNLPQDSGFGKVWMIIDDQVPGNWAADYPRFTKRGV